MAVRHEFIARDFEGYLFGRDPGRSHMRCIRGSSYMLQESTAVPTACGAMLNRVDKDRNPPMIPVSSTLVRCGFVNKDHLVTLRLSKSLHPIMSRKPVMLRGKKSDPLLIILFSEQARLVHSDVQTSTSSHRNHCITLTYWNSCSPWKPLELVKLPDLIASDTN